MFSSAALASYNTINLSAPAHAVAHTNGSDQLGRMSFQTQQSKAGVNLEKKMNISRRN